MPEGITTGLIAAGTLGLTGDAYEGEGLEPVASVFGVTSKGVFIRTTGRWIIFLSSGSFSGPLTIRLDRDDPSLQWLSPGDRVVLSQGSISFPSTGLSISIEGSRIWQPPPRPKPLLNDQDRLDLLTRIANEVNSKGNGIGLGRILPALLASPGAGPPPGLTSGFDWGDILQVRKYLQNREVPSLVRLLPKFLGLGTGLTPSGDDFILGILLTLNRYQDLVWPADNLPDLHSQIVENAYSKTTSLSANLIECAASGLADERLINTLDWIMTGVARGPDILPHLMAWGHSSGLDALAGMFVALTDDNII